MDNTQAPEGPEGVAVKAAEAAVALLPLDVLDAATRLADPVTVARNMPWLAGEMAKIASGRSDLWFDKRDQRFADKAWQANPYRMLAQYYRLYELWMDRMCQAVPGPWPRQARARFLANMATAAAAPSNYLPANPVALRLAAETGGRSLLDGARNLARDLARGGMPRAADRERFPVGEKIAATPGAVVYREEMFELLQYRPTTPRVRERPLLMVPPQVNRYYILDLAPGRSVVEYAVAQGIQTFMIVWRNPRATLGHGRWGVDDYIAAQERAAEVVQKITRTDAIGWLGLCAGGMTTSWMLAHRAATGADPAASATYIVTTLAGEQPNVVGMSDTPASRAELEVAARAGLVIPGMALRTLFALLRPNDLVYNYLVSGWLKGEPPAPFDVLAWNDDATAVPAKFALESTRIMMDGWDGATGPALLGTQADFKAVNCDSFHVAGYTDHITPWRACYSTTQILGGEKELTVVKSGHIQSFVNPEDNPR
ncbi:MAG TPA: alpha/beta fold hydrolase, partial [Streptosporangiaceae bacterium]|nr:alpha/beta fold hydrolase [Streptosporangiaceae bacterium]